MTSLISKLKEDGWKRELSLEFEKKYFKDLELFLKKEKEKGKIIYPEEEFVFNAFNQAPFNKVKAVILGQDPYHGEGQAHGLSFSVPPGVKIPPSLKNIYKELSHTLSLKTPSHGHLTHWASQGVLLLNNVLTVEDSKAAAHKGKGWEQFTDKAIELLNEKSENIVFFLWGAHSQKKAKAVDPERHLVLKSAHPSPLSAYRGFFEQNQFGQCNEYLKSHNKKAIDWQIPEIP